jgi:hypothetical protein
MSKSRKPRKQQAWRPPPGALLKPPIIGRPLELAPLPSPSRSSSAPKGKPANKRHAGGRPPDYPIETIRQIARNYIEACGLPPTATMLREKVRDECDAQRLRVPHETRFKQLVDPIFRKARNCKKSQTSL